MMKASVLAGAIFLASSGVPRASVLSNAAAAMSPGTFAELTGMNNWNDGAAFLPLGCSPGCGSDITEYANKAQWNPIGKRWQFVGISHASFSADNARGVYYDDATNTWGNLPQSGLMTGGRDPRHTYDQNAIDPVTGTHYVTDYNSLKTYILPNGASAWSMTTRMNTGSNCCTADAFFPTYQGGGRLFHWDGTRGLFSYKPATTQWQWHATTQGFDYTCGGDSCPLLPGGGGINVVADYSAACNCVLFGGGSTPGATYWKITTDGTISQMTTANGPTHFQVISPPNGASLVIDPVSGFLIAIDDDGMKQYNPAGTGTWSNVSVTIPSYITSGQGGDAASKLIGAGVSDYGVIMYVKIGSYAGMAGGTKVFLYKHKASATSLSRLSTLNSPYLSVTPNPIHASATLRLSADFPGTGPVEVGLYQPNGKKIWKMESGRTALENGLGFNTNGIPAGIYLCRIRSYGVSQVRKVFVEH